MLTAIIHIFDIAGGRLDQSMAIWQVGMNLHKLSSKQKISMLGNAILVRTISYTTMSHCKLEDMSVAKLNECPRSQRTRALLCEYHPISYLKANITTAVI